MEITQEGRKELWGFGIGDRVRVKDDVHPIMAVAGTFGHITWIGGCSIAATDETCRDRCFNTRVMDATGFEHAVPPGFLEHVD